MDSFNFPTPRPSGAWSRSDFLHYSTILEAALLKIARQPLANEMDAYSRECADWEGGYEALVKMAREALRLPAALEA